MEQTSEEQHFKMANLIERWDGLECDSFSPEDVDNDPFFNFEGYGFDDGSYANSQEEPPDDVLQAGSDPSDNLFSRHNLDLEEGLFFLEQADKIYQVHASYINQVISSVERDRRRHDFLNLGNAVCKARDLIETNAYDLVEPWLSARGVELIAFNQVVGRVLETMDMDQTQKELLDQFRGDILAYWLHRLLVHLRHDVDEQG